MRAFAIASLFIAAVVAAPAAENPSELVERQACTNGNIFVGGQTCNLRCNTDMPGGNERTVLGTTITSCANECAMDGACVVAQRDASNGNCYLKLQTTQFVNKPGIDTVQCPNECVSGVRTIGGRQCTFTCGSDRNGPSFSQLSTINTVDCAQKCAANSQCISATFWSGHCYLKSQQYTLTSNGNVNAVDCV